jgi:hypothetical protein
LASSRPGQRIAVDTIGPLPESTDGFKYIIVIIDCFSRWVDVYPTKDTTAASAADVLLQYCGRFGFADEMVTDWGPEFHNNIVDALCLLCGVDRIYSLAYNKQHNGIVERVNKEILRHLRVLLMHKDTVAEWRISLPLVQRIINGSIHSSIGVSPAQLLFGKFVDLSQGIFTSDPRTTESMPDVSIQQYADRLFAQQTRLLQVAVATQSATNIHHLEGQSEDVKVFDIHDWVLVSYPTSRMNMRAPTKLDVSWNGPMQIVSRDLIHSVYELFNPATGNLTRFMCRV